MENCKLTMKCLETYFVDGSYFSVDDLCLGQQFHNSSLWKESAQYTPYNFLLSLYISSESSYDWFCRSPSPQLTPPSPLHPTVLMELIMAATLMFKSHHHCVQRTWNLLSVLIGMRFSQSYLFNVQKKVCQFVTERTEGPRCFACSSTWRP